MEHFADIPIIDTHVHPTRPCTLRETLKNLQDKMTVLGYERIVLQSCCETAQKGFDPYNGAEALWLKLHMPHCYACGTPVHFHNEYDTAEGYEEQIRMMWDMGFDGVKMMEGKPNRRKRLARRLDDPIFDGFYGFSEAEGVPLTLHLADPDFFWDRDRVSDSIIRHGWYWGDGTYVSYEQLYDELWGILKKFPRLPLTLAHFGFMSEKKDWAERFLGDYENTCFDITPGTEMFAGFSKDPDYWRDFFIRYRRRIYYGTDTYNDPCTPENPGSGADKYTLIRTYLESDADFQWRTTLGPVTLHPLALPEDVLRDIYRENALRRFGAEPRQVV